MRYGYWNPGYWRPVRSAPRAGYAYVPGWWDGDIYIEGYYRRQARRDGSWRWIDGQYANNGQYSRGHWEPQNSAPEGYVWEPGFYDGETYVDGFWRPQFRNGFTWLSAYYDEDGIFHAGYWLPITEEIGFTWVPGWFDGNQWVEGYWVRADEYASEDVQNWQPAEGWDDGWEVGSGWGDGEVIDAGAVDSGIIEEDLPLALPAN